MQPSRGAVAVFAGIPALGHFTSTDHGVQIVYPAMDDQELRRRAAHYKRVASLVSDEVITEALLELAAAYEAMADSLGGAPSRAAKSETGLR